MKKALKSLIALCMAFSLVFPSVSVFAANLVSVYPTYRAAGQGQSETGSLDVQIDLDFPVSNPELTVTLMKDGNSYEYTENITEETIYYNFKELPVGTGYSLTIKGDGFDYKNDSIEITQGLAELVLTNSYLVRSDEKVGIINFGDISEDLVKQCIEKGTYNESYDLNNDGKVDIVDLSYVILNKESITESNRNRKGSVLYQLNLENATVSETTGTTITGEAELEDILKNNGVAVSFKPTNEEPISPQNPVQVTIDLSENEQTTGGIVIAPSNNPENNIKQGIVTVETDEGTLDILIGAKPNEEVKTVRNSAKSLKTINELTGETSIRLLPADGKDLSDVTPIAYIEKDGSIVIDLGTKIAIKKVTITVTGTSGNTLADISKVEFLNGMEDRIPEPTMDIPEELVGTPGSEQFTVTWKGVTNITGYEVSISCDGKTEYQIVEIPTITVTRFNNDKIKNGKIYEVKVQSINGNWRSGWSNSINVEPVPTEAPEAPQMINLPTTSTTINASWKDMPNTERYYFYYRVKAEDGNPENEFILANPTDEKDPKTWLTTSKYLLTGLTQDTTYEIKIIAANRIGQSKPAYAECVTKSIKPAIMPTYGLINTPNGVGEKTNHIKNATLNVWSMVNSKLDENGKTAFGIVDNDFTSYYQVNDWDVGVSYNDTVPRTPTIEFDDYFEMNYFTFAQVEDYDQIRSALIFYEDESGNVNIVKPMQVYTKRDTINNRDYTVVKLGEKIKTNKITINMSRIYPTRNITVAEMRFFDVGDLEYRVNDLFADQLHAKLKKGVTSTLIESLIAEANTIDEKSQEYHPEKDSILKELEVAKKILGSEQLDDAIVIDPTVSEKYDSNISFIGGLNAWQPLGVVAYAGEEISVFVENTEKKVGEATDLQLIITQYHGEANSWKAQPVDLLIGENKITIPSDITYKTDVERGGSLYINYKGNNPNDAYTVGVRGGQKIPVLDLSNVSTKEVKLELIKQYITELEKKVKELETNHEAHKTESESVNIEYNERLCILGATEIVLDQMMYSVASPQILKGIEEGLKPNATLEEKANKLYNSLEAMNEMIDLFYAHKGLNKNSKDINRYPTSRLNIRYHTMFVGAFMYAGGQHIGIEYNEVAGLANGEPIKSKNGKYISGGYFGWGIAHEIGHIINEKTYEYAEITNNYFSVLAQAKETNESVRFSYDEVYKKVTSGKIGKSSNVFTQLGLYWQLHLAYDKGYNYKTYNSYDEQYKNLFFARVDSIVRDTSKAKAPNNIKLTLDGDKDNNLMRLAVAASEKNILEFFRRWGMVPDEITESYASQFPKEERAIYYITDEVRDYQLQNNPALSEVTLTANIDREKSEDNKVVINFSIDNNSDALLGYEIIRSYHEGVNKEDINTRAIAFVTSGNTYTDTIETINNRVFTYKVAVYDKYLNKVAEQDIGSIKVSHEGIIDKSEWVIETNLESQSDDKKSGDEIYPCDPVVVSDIEKLKENTENAFVGTYSEKYDKTLFGEENYLKENPDKDGVIIISLAEKTSLVALKYTAGESNPILNYEIQISKNKVDWEKVKEGTFSLDENNSQVVYFNKEGDGEPKDKLFIYDATYVKLIAKNIGSNSISIAGIDLIGQTGDNIELIATEDSNGNQKYGIGRLSEAYKYGETEDDVFEARTIIFTGTYKGNPAYNTVLLKDKDNVGINGTQIILAEHPGNGQLGEVKEGIWIYAISEEDYERLKGTSVRAELYRTTDSSNKTRERFVSDSNEATVPAVLPPIKLESKINN